MTMTKNLFLIARIVGQLYGDNIMAKIDNIVDLLRNCTAVKYIEKPTNYQANLNQHAWCYIKVKTDEYDEMLWKFVINSYKSHYRLIVGIPHNTPNYMKVEYK